MRSIKNIISLILFVVLIILGVKLFETLYSPCDTPITYKIGSIDPRFGLTKQTLLSDLEEASRIISDDYGKPLFVYSDDGTLTVNFVYDARTALEQNITKQQNLIDLQNMSLQDRVNQYKADVVAFEQKLATYNATVERYNNEGGAPPDIYNQLNSERGLLQTEGDALNTRAKQLNLETNNYNAQVDNLNKNVNQFNQAITQKPEEGLYDGSTNTISIYFVDNKPELIHTLAHEFGHALGMIHIDDPEAIMYPSTSKTLTMTMGDKQELESVCKSYPIGVHWINSLIVYMNSLFSPRMKLAQ
jgi:hypothetical protein